MVWLANIWQCRAVNTILCKRSIIKFEIWTWTSHLNTKFLFSYVSLIYWKIFNCFYILIDTIVRNRGVDLSRGGDGWDNIFIDILAYEAAANNARQEIDWSNCINSHFLFNINLIELNLARFPMCRLFNVNFSTWKIQNDSIAQAIPKWFLPPL